MRDARCSLCGELMPGDLIPDIEYTSSLEIFKEDEKWKTDFRKHKYVIGEAEDLNRVYFQLPWLWGRLYRTVYEIWDGLNGSLHLSGVSLQGDWMSRALYAPRDPSQLIMGDPKRIPDGLLQTLSIGEVGRDRRPLYSARGYPMHERCWQLFTRILDVDLIASHLRLFLEVLHRRADQFIYNPENLHHEEGEWKSMEQRYGDAALEDPQRKSIKPKEKVKEPVKEKKTPDKRTPRSHRMSLRASSTSNVRSIVVPTEIILTIMDRLPDIDDILSLLWVFPHWKGLIPQGYWRIRCINELVLDEDQVPDRDSLNWGYLYFNIDDILARSHGWRNRRRIMTILEGTKEMFLKELAKQRMGKNGHTRC
ncbi:hypothetical protein MW887_004324 [Aspergillus wentii]|nr:hypothetical protein MW887_004324 [Aspergillus wentii]